MFKTILLWSLYFVVVLCRHKHNNYSMYCVLFMLKNVGGQQAIKMKLIRWITDVMTPSCHKFGARNYCVFYCDDISHNDAKSATFAEYDRYHIHLRFQRLKLHYKNSSNANVVILRHFSEESNNISKTKIDINLMFW